MAEHRPDGVLTLIGAFKIVKTLSLIAAGAGLIALSDHGAPTLLGRLGVDPDNRYIDALLAKLALTNAHELRELSVGSFVYAALFATEGTGLLLRRLWAEYLTIAITASFIPLEIYEMVDHGSVVKAIVIAANVAIVIYLVWRLRRDNHWPFG